MSSPRPPAVPRPSLLSALGFRHNFCGEEPTLAVAPGAGRRAHWAPSFGSSRLEADTALSIGLTALVATPTSPCPDDWADGQ